MRNGSGVMDRPERNYWAKRAYMVPDTPRANIRPGETDVKFVPISRMVPRSFITNIKEGDTLQVGASTLARGIAFGGDSGVSRVDFSSDGGKSWREAALGTDEGKYSFRQWQLRFNPPTKGGQVLTVRCTTSRAAAHPA